MDQPVSVFLSYRRADTPYAAGRLADRLGERFKLFMDIDIAPGLHFGRALTEAVEGCDAMVVLIGPSWLTAVEEDGSRRLDNPRDWVVQEIESALAREVTVIPVLVDGARMPTPDQLPEPLEALGVPAGDQPAARVVRHRHRRLGRSHRAGRARRTRRDRAESGRPEGRGAAGRGLARAEGTERSRRRHRGRTARFACP